MSGSDSLSIQPRSTRYSINRSEKSSFSAWYISQFLSVCSSDHQSKETIQSNGNAARLIPHSRWAWAVIQTEPRLTNKGSRRASCSICPPKSASLVLTAFSAKAHHSDKPTILSPIESPREAGEFLIGQQAKCQLFGELSIHAVVDFHDGFHDQPQPPFLVLAPDSAMARTTISLVSSGERLLGKNS